MYCVLNTGSPLLEVPLYCSSVVLRPIPSFSMYQRATLKSWEGPGDEASIALC